MLTLNIGNRLRTGRWLLLAMIVLLHGALLLGVESPWTHPLLLAHLGLFLLWQPLWRGEHEVGRGALAFIIVASVVAMFWLSWWAIAFWLTGLFGLVGARVFVFRDRWSRLLYLSLIVYLLAVLLLWVVPNIFKAQSSIEVGRILIWYVLPVLLLIMAFMPLNKESADSSQTVDFIYSLMLFMLLTLVVLGSLAYMTLGRLDYLEALLRTLFLIGLVMLALGGFWNPRFGFSGLQVMFSRYLLNVGTPFESWLTQLTSAAHSEPNATSYLRRAIVLLEDLAWLSGLSWQSAGDTGQFGQFSEYAAEVQEGELRLTLYAKQPLNPTLLLHVHLLMQLIGYFYQAKQREQNLRDITRLQAVYETGSRLTHDLKNMLQSLHSLTSIAQSREERAQQLLLQQLPLLTQRIEMTLIKLRQPLLENETPQLALNAWWDTLRLRNRYQHINWHAQGSLPDKNIPVALFDCIIDNLIDNAVRKRQSEPGITISVEIQPYPLRLIACDSGDPVPENITENLLRGAVVSGNGLGIGLYQAARWAEQLGYRLTLANNQPGKVCFELGEADAGQRREGSGFVTAVPRN
jgi:signal transduction histidine kinase